MLQRFIKVFLVLCLIVLSGCRNDKTEEWTWEMWLTQLSLEGGFSVSEENAIHDLNGFDVVDVSRYALDAPLTYLMVKECAQSLTDKASMLNKPVLNENTVLTSQQAEKLLNELVELMNDFSDDDRFEIEYDREVIVVNVLDRQNGRYLIEQSVNVHDLVEINQTVYEVKEVSDHWITVEPVSMKHVDSMELQGSASFDLSEATTVVQGKIVQVDQSVGAGLSALTLSQSFQVHGFQVRISSSADSLHVYASRKMESGQPIFVQFDINQVQCDFKWKSTKDQINASALKVSYETSLTSGLRSTDYEDRVLDFSKMDTAHLMESLKTGFVKKSDALLDSIELCEIHLPFPQMPSVVLKMKVMLHLYAGGRAEIGFENNHEEGFEFVNGKLRLIHDVEKDAHFSVRGSVKASTKLQFILSAFLKDLMDVQIETGLQGNVICRLSDVHQSVQSDVSYEVMEEIEDQHDGLKVCADLDAYWLLNLSLNSSKTLLGSLGISHQFDLIDQSNGSLFGQSIHLENFQRVEKCTGTINIDEIEIKLNLDRIELKHYLLILDENESRMIEITALPYGTQKEDVIYDTSDVNVANVTSNGKVKALHSGNAIITVSMKDGTYASQCSVFVR